MRHVTAKCSMTSHEKVQVQVPDKGTKGVSIHHSDTTWKRFNDNAKIITQKTYV